MVIGLHANSVLHSISLRKPDFDESIECLIEWAKAKNYEIRQSYFLNEIVTNWLDLSAIWNDFIFLRDFYFTKKKNDNGTNSFHL